MLRLGGGSLRLGAQNGDTAATLDSWFAARVDATSQCPRFA